MTPPNLVQLWHILNVLLIFSTQQGSVNLCRQIPFPILASTTCWGHAEYGHTQSLYLPLPLTFQALAWTTSSSPHPPGFSPFFPVCHCPSLDLSASFSKLVLSVSKFRASLLRGEVKMEAKSWPLLFVIQGRMEAQDQFSALTSHRATSVKVSAKVGSDSSSPFWISINSPDRFVSGLTHYQSVRRLNPKFSWKIRGSGDCASWLQTSEVLLWCKWRDISCLYPE